MTSTCLPRSNVGTGGCENDAHMLRAISFWSRSQTTSHKSDTETSTKLGQAMEQERHHLRFRGLLLQYTSERIALAFERRERALSDAGYEWIQCP